MKSLWQKFSLFLFFVASACSHTGTPSKVDAPRVHAISDSTPRIVVLHLSDLHGRLRPGADNLGGYARIRSWIKSEEAKAGAKTDIVVVGGGDFTDKGSMPCLQKNDLPCMPLLSTLGIHFSVMGNHEIQRPLSEWRNLQSLSNIAWLSANVSPLSGPKSWEPYRDFIGAKSGLSLRFIAFTKILDREAHPRSYKDFRFHAFPKSEADWRTLIPKALPYVLLNHVPEEDDRAMAASLCQTPLPKPLMIFKGDDERERWKSTMDCVEAYEAGPHGKIGGRYVFERVDGSLKLVDASFVSIDARFPEEAQLKNKIDELYRENSPTAAEILANAHKDYTQMEMAQWLADAYRMVTRADIAVVNIGVSKSGLAKGEQSRENLRFVFPYVNQLMGLDWAYEQMSRALCRAASRKMEGDSDWGSELVISGGKLSGVGTPECRLESGRKGRLKVVVDDFMYKKSARWLGEDLSRYSTWRFGVESTLAIEERLKRDKKSL